MNAAPFPQADSLSADPTTQAITAAPLASAPTPPPAPPHWWESVYANNALYAWIGAVVLGVAVYFGLTLVRSLLVTRLKNIVDRTATRVDDLVLAILADIRSWFFFATAVYAGASVLIIPATAERAGKILFIVAAVVQTLLSSRLAVEFVIKLVIDRHKNSNDETDRSIASASGIIRFLVMFVLGCLLVLLALSNMGVQITPLLTGLGIGGVAVVLAAQSLLSDVFGSLTIVFDKPFLVGDYIVVGQQQGTVEHIGIKTTRVRALSGEQLVFANSDLLGSRIQNFKRMQQRRATGNLEIVYQTPIDKVRRMPDLIRESIRAAGGDKVRIDNAVFKSIGNYALEFEYVYYVLSAEYNVYAAIQQGINIELLLRMQREEISMAYPTSTAIALTTQNEPARSATSIAAMAASDDAVFSPGDANADSKPAAPR